MNEVVHDGVGDLLSGDGNDETIELSGDFDRAAETVIALEVGNLVEENELFRDFRRIGLVDILEREHAEARLAGGTRTEVTLVNIETTASSDNRDVVTLSNIKEVLAFISILANILLVVRKGTEGNSDRGTMIGVGCRDD